MRRYLPAYMALALALLGAACPGVACGQALEVPNSGFEAIRGEPPFPAGWQPGIGGGAQATVEADAAVRHGGARSVRITNRSPLKAFVYAMFSSEPVAVQPLTTYVARVWVRGRSAQSCFAGINFEGDGERRLYLPTGDFDWRLFAVRFTTPERCRALRLSFACDDVTDGIWFDDVTLERAPVQQTNLAEQRYPKDFEGVFPRSKGPVARRLTVLDMAGQSDEMEFALASLQGIVNRRQPRLYLINRTNPADYDALWLRYMQEKGYTGPEERVSTPDALLARFRAEIRGVILYDPELPGSVQAAGMMAGLENALPVSPALSARWSLPVVADLRGRWTRNVDAYRYVYDRYWPRMCHHVLAWTYPLAGCRYARDYTTQFNIFCFWFSGYGDNEKGADPEAEEAFINELLADTPGNIPVMGWPMYGDKKGMPEYSGVRWLSEYGKFVPGTEYCSNLSVHTAIRPSDRLFRRKSAPRTTEAALQSDKVYLSVNILDSGDGLWYWQYHQRKIWSDPTRGSVPIGWCMNTTLYDTLPLVLQWYCEQATPNDTFFAAVSGLGYMNTQVYASRFRPADRERIWTEYVAAADRYRRKLALDGVEIYNGGWGEKTPPSPETFRRFTRGMKGLNYILADLGRHDNITPENANSLLEETAVFHTLTRFRLWTSSAEVANEAMDESNAWLLNEIKANAPSTRPGFMSAMAISWYYYPSWLKDLRAKLPPEYVMVSPAELARRFRQYRRSREFTAPPARQKQKDTHNDMR